MNTIDLTCSCGARLLAMSRYGGDIARERRAFDEAHAPCRTASAANRSTPRSRYLVSTDRKMPRGILGRRLSEGAPVPPPPPRPAPLPNPTTPSI